MYYVLLNHVYSLASMSIKNVLTKYMSPPYVKIVRVYKSLLTSFVHIHSNLSPLGECSHCMHLVGQIQSNVPPSSRLFLEMLLVDILIRNIQLLYKMRMFIVQQKVLRTSTWNQLKPVPTNTNYLTSTLILICHVWIIVIRHSKKKIINLRTLRTPMRVICHALLTFLNLFIAIVG